MGHATRHQPGTWRKNAMPVIGRRRYHNAMIELCKAAGVKVEEISLCRLLLEAYKKRLLLDVAGKNLPYYGRRGQKAFFWETHIRPERVGTLEAAASQAGAEPWFAFCYAVFEHDLERHFRTIVKIDEVAFGTRLIGAGEYREHMQPRSPSWGEVELPRKRVLELTIDPSDLIRPR